MKRQVLENPFPGLRPFREGEEYLFFGRESQVDGMVDKLAATRFLSVVGTSGSGKSSLVTCGLKPALNRGLMGAAGATWRMCQFRPGANPVRSLAEAWTTVTSPIPNMHPDGPSLLEMVEATLRMSSLGISHLFEYAHFEPGTSLLLIVDQFEELFRYGAAATRSQDTYGVTKEAAAFVKLLLEARIQTQYPIYIVLTMRSDFLGECSQFEGLPETLNEGQYLIPRMTRDERREAITGPIEVSGGEISPVLLSRLVNDVGENPDQLSLLQHAVNRTWVNWQLSDAIRGPMSLANYDAVGTMARALDKHAEEAYAELKTDRERWLCERIFRALTDKGTDARGIRRPMSLQALCAVVGSEEGEVRPILDLMRSPQYSFLMPPPPQNHGPNTKDNILSDTMIDISHEILMRVWETLKVWTAAEAESAFLYRRLADSAELHAAGKESLWRDPGLQTALDWYEGQKPNEDWAQLYRPGFDVAMNFLAASQKERDSERSLAELERQWHRVSPILGIFVAIGFFFVLREYIPTLEKTIREDISDVGKSLSHPWFEMFTVATPFIAGILTYAGLMYAAKRLFTRVALPLITKKIKGSSTAEVKAKHMPGVLVAKLNADTTSSFEILVYAGFWQRVCADVLDLAIMLTVVYTLFILAIIMRMTGSSAQSSAPTFFVFCVFTLMLLLYPAISAITPANASVGDTIFGLAVLRTNGTRPRFWRMVLRSFLKMLVWFPLFGLGFLIQPFVRQKRALHDLVCGTIVVKRRKRYLD